MPHSIEPLFSPLAIKNLTLPNRIVMAPMTRSHSPEGVPGANVAAYYKRRAQGAVGLIITEGTYIPHPAAGFDPNVPHMEGDAAMDGWRAVVDTVHASGGKIFSQLWHVGMQTAGGPQPTGGLKPVGASMPSDEIEKVVAAYGKAAANAKAAGFDGVEIHAAHGYLIDQFFWEKSNTRSDKYGGDLVARTRLAVETTEEIRRQTGPEFPIALRFSQWKIEDYEAKLANTPQELDRFLAPLVDAGVDILHASTRRFWDAEFPDADANLGLAGWTKKLTGKPVIAVGSVTLGADVMVSFGSPKAVPTTGIDALLERMERQEFDMIAIGRSLIANPTWPELVRHGQMDQLQPFRPEVLGTLY